MNQSYENALDAIEFYQLHPEYKPFIGDRYDAFKILHVGESHFIPQQVNEPDVFPITYFQNWWGDACEELKNCQQKNCHNEDGYQWGAWFRTRSVIENYLNGCRTRSHGIFTEMVKVFATVCQNRTILHIDDEEGKNYNHFAFMNFFQMPALYAGMKYWTSLKKSALKSGMTKKQAKAYANKVWDDTVRISSCVLDKVIGILNPSIVIFTSKSAAKAYNGEYKNTPKVITAVHPASPHWHISKNGQSGKERLIEQWNLLRQSDATPYQES